MTDQPAEFAKFLVELADRQKLAGQDCVMVFMTIKQAYVVAKCVENYFAETVPQCFMCGQSRQTEFDRALNTIDEDVTRMSLMVADLEFLLQDKLERERPSDEVVFKERIRPGSRFRNQKIHVSDELRQAVLTSTESLAEAYMRGLREGEARGRGESSAAS